MDDKTFQEKLADLVKDINQLPASEQGKAMDLANEAKARQDRMKKTIGELTESLDYLRLSVKYLVFDLEATRRENAYLRSMVEKLAKGGTIDAGNSSDMPNINAKTNRGPRNTTSGTNQQPRQNEIEGPSSPSRNGEKEDCGEDHKENGEDEGFHFDGAD